ncbi:hypothetical protein [Synechococcus sp. UW179A]|uniref:hypothetical protein n=1 Tax=Synechococcus sp. UW179A TaxID=2575510 RepID=UPI0010BE87D0|nr:hypothetical protein [Synechococcus sp. UW179A]
MVGSGFRGLFDATGCRVVSKRQLQGSPLGRIVGKEPELRGCEQHPICGSALALVAAAATAAAATEEFLLAAGLRG